MLELGVFTVLHFNCRYLLPVVVAILALGIFGGGGAMAQQATGAGTPALDAEVKALRQKVETLEDQKKELQTLLSKRIGELEPGGETQ